ncbi:DUF1428 domain-containing protein [Ahrensia sp. 13_GOM-1096m]|uniref:DUF1428 domain-containing protein n=1 Tax=Ahrensia sp. 13_GOM-1096m TaxID=1380380 RepID=UPI00047C909E|nr:DUF1428 family protein [Ahrensia sp. 13_GOM-1096m]
MTFFNIYVAAVPKANKDQFITHAENVAALFKENGVMKYIETWGVDVPDGEITSFHKAVQKSDDEDVVVGWMQWPSKEIADAAWSKIMEDPRMTSHKELFDGKRMIYGGFEGIVDA